MNLTGISESLHSLALQVFSARGCDNKKADIQTRALVGKALKKLRDAVIDNSEEQLVDLIHGLP